MVKGLVNLGNTCYFNSALQCLLQTPQLTNLMIHKNYTGDCEFTKEYQRLSREMWTVTGDGGCRPLNPQKLLTVFQKLFPTFKDGRQQDVQEVYLCVLDILSKSLGKFVKDVFYRPTVQETICKSGKSTRSGETNVVMLESNSSSSDTVPNVGDLFKACHGGGYSTVESGYVDDDGVSHHVAATRAFFLDSQPPLVLVMTFKTYHQKKKITLTDTLLDGQYTLYATCIHTGSATAGGHYVACVKHKDIWYLKDDGAPPKKLELFPFTDYHYLFFYKRNYKQ